MDNTVKKRVLLFILFVLILLILTASFCTQNTYAAAYFDSVPIYLREIDENNKFVDTQLGSITVETSLNTYYTYGYTTSTSSDIALAYYLNKYNLSFFRILDSNNSQLQVSINNSSTYTTLIKNGIPKKIVIAKPYSQINYQLDGGSIGKYSPEGVYVDSACALYPATKENYTFSGWYLESTYNTAKYDLLGTENVDYTIYAKWQQELKTKITTSDSSLQFIQSKGDLVLSMYDNNRYCFLVEDLDRLLNTSLTKTSIKMNDTDYILSYNKKYYVFEIKDSPSQFSCNVILSYKDTNITSKTIPLTVTNIDTKTIENYRINCYLNADTNGKIQCIVDSSTFDSKLETNSLFITTEVYCNSEIVNTYTKIDDKIELNSSFYSKDIYIIINLKKVYYSITYELYEGTNNQNNPTQFKAGDKLTFYEATKDNFIFKGWYFDSEFTLPITDIDTSTTKDIVLYAKFNEIFSVDIYSTIVKNGELEHNFIQKTKACSALNDTYYFIGETYSVDIKNLMKENNYTDIRIYSINDELLTCTVLNNGTLATYFRNATPSYIILSSDYYSINYNLNDGEFEKEPIHYYTSKEDFILTTPIKDGFKFLGWYRSEDFQDSISNSDFKHSENLVLYAKWTALFDIDLYLYENVNGNPTKSIIDTISYYILLDSYYCYGEYETDAIKIAMKKYNVISFFVEDKLGNRFTSSDLNGKQVTRTSEGIPDKIYIYNYYEANYIVNGVTYYSQYGDFNEKINTPTNITGFIGHNFDIVNIGSLSIGKDYALYTFKGWSLSDSSEKMWFNGTSVDIDENPHFLGENGGYCLNFYAYMKYNCKIDKDANSLLDYDAIITETNGIITSNYKYTLDDLLNAHMIEKEDTVISNNPTFSSLDKLAKLIGVDINSTSWISFKKLTEGQALTIDEVTNTSWAVTLLTIVLVCMMIMLILCITKLFKVFNKE